MILEVYIFSLEHTQIVDKEVDNSNHDGQNMSLTME